MCEILAHAAPLFEEGLHRRGDLRGLLVKAEILVDSAGEIEDRRQQWTCRRKRLARISGEFRTGPHALGIENELPGVQDFAGGLGSVAGQRLPHGLPGRGRRKIRRSDGSHFQSGIGFYDQGLMRLVQGEEGQSVAEVVGMGGGDRRGGQDGHVAFPARLFRQIPRSQTQHMVRHRDGILIMVRGAVLDAIDQVARSLSA
jgi:hypothetical protein